MTQWKRELSADEVRFLVTWFADTYDEKKPPTIWAPVKAEAVRRKIDEIAAKEKGY